MIAPKVAFSLKCAEHTYNCIITAASSRHYSLKTVCGCQCGRVISGHTCNALTQWNAFVSAQLHILDDPQSVQLSNATATTTTTTATRTTTTATTATYCTKDLLAARGGQQASCRKTRLSTEQSWLALLVD